ncbi:heat-inducible transcriptional repressor HrcA [Ruania halotolerans]|uniref:heat-inducible transcriptional repressor HrcA n=1 Tax=Ruania halotolerans TaxID=2897773 RepID=UPI001E4F913B|nr:heat-inducible transcriptional repressor HrcA [Ruania halotolerans]UFU04938.1 heat-inducible transcriptional repressor HrcA [Ruania halotolerans]
MSSQRQLQVLRAIVQDYVRSREPVGSRNLVDRHNLNVSPATIRNDMAALEEGGYIAQPHTSAGRIPTDKGYRLFVDQISVIKPLSGVERRAIGELLDGAVDLDDVLERTVRLLAQLTQQVAVVQYPSLRRSALRHVELIPTGPRHLLVVIITANGRVEQRTVESATDLDETMVAELRARVNAEVAGRNAARLRTVLAGVEEAFAPVDQPLVSGVLGTIMDTLSEDAEERIVMAGTANLARSDVDFSGTIGPVLEALEEHVVLLRLLSEMAAGDAEAAVRRDHPLAVRIGSETHHENLLETSIVASGYGGDGTESVGQLGILGPTRMDYPSTMAAVRAVARYLSRFLGG